MALGGRFELITAPGKGMKLLVHLPTGTSVASAA
jgi:hypothetical protein